MSAADQVRESLEPVIAPLGLVIEDVTVSPAGKRRVVRVLVDTDLGDLDPADATSIVEPLSLDQVAEATHAVSAALDASAALGDAPYVLEVSSPGVGRPVGTYTQFRRNVGRLVHLDLRDGNPVVGRLVQVAGAILLLDVPATKKTPQRLVSVNLGDVRRGTVEVEFNRAPQDPAAPDHPSGAAEKES